MGSDADPLREAVAELYSADPAEFVERRGALAARARAAGEASAAKSIAALRKPTRSAWVVNQLIRSDPGVIAELGGLGDELRAAQGSMDGAAIREPSVRRGRGPGRPRGAGRGERSAAARPGRARSRWWRRRPRPPRARRGPSWTWRAMSSGWRRSSPPPART